jgi:hypothetical protein
VDICSILFFDSFSEYFFAIIAAGIVTLMSESMWLSHTKKNFWPPLQHNDQHDIYSFIFDDILSFQAQEKRYAIWFIMVGKENQTHRGATMPRITRLWNRSQGSDPGNYDGSH